MERSITQPTKQCDKEHSMSDPVRAEFEKRFATGHEETDKSNFRRDHLGGYAENRIDALWEGWAAAREALSTPVPEFCCEHSWSAAKMLAWKEVQATKCNCDHNESCLRCWPLDFRAGGKWASYSAQEKETGPLKETR
jgi:hypothetical protein